MVIISPPPLKLRVMKVLHHAGDWEENKSYTENELVRTKAVTILAGELELGCISKRVWQCSFLAGNTGLNSPQMFLLCHPQSLALIWRKLGGSSVGQDFCCSIRHRIDLSGMGAEWKLWNQELCALAPLRKGFKTHGFGGYVRAGLHEQLHYHDHRDGESMKGHGDGYPGWQPIKQVSASDVIIKSQNYFS